MNGDGEQDKNSDGSKENIAVNPVAGLGSADQPAREDDQEIINHEDAKDKKPGKSDKQHQSDSAKEETEKEEDLSSAREVCQECLEEMFGADNKLSLLNIIANNFKESKRWLDRKKEVDDIIYNLLDHCDNNGGYEKLWSALKKESAKKNQEDICKQFYSRWKDRFQEEQDEKNQEKRRRCAEKNQKYQENGDDISSWFHKLNYIDQSTVITAALFDCIERNVFQELAREIQKLLFCDENGAEKVQQAVSGEQKEQATSVLPHPLENEQDVLQRTRLKIELSEKNTNYGLTSIEIVTFEYKEYRSKLLKLIRSNIHAKKYHLFNFIKKILTNSSSDAEKRFFAVDAVVALSESHLFTDLLDCIIIEWANTESYYTRRAAAAALSGIFLKRRYENEILCLLNSWLTLDNNTSLNITSLSAYDIIAEERQEEAICAAEIVFGKENNGYFMLTKGRHIAYRLYNNDTEKFISCIYRWINSDNEILRHNAGECFLYFIESKDVINNNPSKGRIIEIISSLWKGKKMPNRLQIQKKTAAKIKKWAKEALLALENGNNEIFSKYREFFYELHGSCADKIDFYLKIWQEEKEDQENSLDKTGRISSRNITFLSLLPKGV